MSGARRQRGFTIIELLVVIGIIAVLIALAIPVVGSAIDNARQTKCQANARSVLTGISGLMAETAGRLPENRTLVNQREHITWRQQLVDAGYSGSGDAWTCPLHENPGSELGYQIGTSECVGDVTSSYALNGHLLWRREKTDKRAERSDAIVARPAHTILLAESNLPFSHIRASDPFVANYYGVSPGAYGYWHDGRGVYGFLDGHVELIRFLDTGSPDCRWHSGRDLTPDPFVPQRPNEVRPHEHPDWEFLVPEIYLKG